MSNATGSASSGGNVRRAARWGVVAAAAGVAAVALAVAGTDQRVAAQAGAIDPLASALGFNVFVEHDTRLVSTESEGPIATGGDLSFAGGYNVALNDPGTFVVGGDAEPSSLVVGGAVDFDGSAPGSIVRVLGGSYVKIGDLSGADVRNTDGNNASVNTRIVPDGAGYDSTPRIELTVAEPVDAVGPASPIDFGAAFADFREQTALLDQCTANVTMRDSAGNAVPTGEVEPGQQIYVELIAGQTNVLDLTGADLNDMSVLTFQDPPTADTPLLINVDTSATGGVFDWTVAPQAGSDGGTAPYILWNFPTTTDLTIGGGDSLYGSVYAPNAHYTNVSPTNVDGQIVAESAQFGDTGASGGETHYVPFAARLECESTPTPSPSATTAGPTESPTGPGGNGGTSAAHHDRGLPTTGAPVAAIAAAAIVLVSGGAAAILAARSRRRTLR